MNSAILVTASFDGIWPWAADAARRQWEREGEVEFHRLGPEDDRAVADVLRAPATVHRLLVLGGKLTPGCVGRLAGLREIAVCSGYAFGVAETAPLAVRGVKVHAHTTEGFWGESVAEFGLALLYDKSISKLEKRDIDAKMRKSYQERYQYFLAIAALLLFLEPFISDKKGLGL